MILIDDQPYARPCPAGKTVRDLAREVCAGPTCHDRRMVVAVYCDGQPVADDRLEAVLNAPASQFDELGLQTQPLAALVTATIEQALGSLEDASGIRTAAADLLDRGREAEAMQELQKLLDIWRQVQQSLVFSAEAAGIDLNSLQTGECRFADLVNRMKTGLSDLRGAMRNHDTVLIADLLRYDLEEVFTGWAELLATVRASLEHH